MKGKGSLRSAGGLIGRYVSVGVLGDAITVEHSGRIVATLTR